MRALASGSSAPASAPRLLGPALLAALARLPVLAVLAACGGAAPDADAAAGGAAPMDAAPPGVVREAAGVRVLLQDVEVPTEALLQAVSPVSERVVWISGHEGAWVRTVDGGRSWSTGARPGGDTLQFRDVEAFGEDVAYLMGAGDGALSRVYRTDDGGGSWALQSVASDSSAFYSCMAAWDEDTAVVWGDEFDGSLFMLRTGDGGRTWRRLSGSALPAAQESEGGFAASGTCAAAGEGGRGWVATGNAARARILRTEDRGRTWSALDAPVEGGTMTGLFTVAVRGERGVALGGAVGADTARGRYVAVSDDGGRTWREGGAMAMSGPVYGAAVVPGLHGPVVVAVGPGGMDWSPDGGATWRHADDRTYWAVGFAGPAAGWAAGPGGRVTRIAVERPGGG